MSRDGIIIQQSIALTHLNVHDSPGGVCGVTDFCCITSLPAQLMLNPE